ncbi:MAG TPA: ferredoxin family protein [Nitrososphaera sp.]|nr:ferredoxin family protein [Nitrososphaera sp.]
MALDPTFQTNWVATALQNLNVWKDHSCNLGIYGTNAALDFDRRIGDAACIEVCPVYVLEVQGPAAGRKTLSSRERDGIYCLECQAACRKFAIWVSKP